MDYLNFNPLTKKHKQM